MDKMMNDFFTNNREEVSITRHFIEDYAQTNSPLQKMVPMTSILREWGQAKRDLYQLLGNQFDYKFVSKCGPPQWELEEAMNAVIRSRGDDIFFRLRTFAHNNIPEGYTEEESLDYISHWNVLLRAMFNTKNLINNTMVLSHHLPRKLELNGNVYCLQNGMKPMRLLGRLCKDNGLENEYETFRQMHAEVLNTTPQEQEVVLSIRPLDYLTMSESTTWSSCMNWHDGGDYRMGTVEMMNSPIVVVAYIAHKDPMYIRGQKWNNKKWRELFIVDKDMIAEVKSYPSRNENLSWIIIEKLKELAAKNWGITDYSSIATYDETNFQVYASSPKELSDTQVRLSVSTNAMYNDFNCTCPYYCLSIGAIQDRIIERDGNKKITIEKNYSGATECIWCGKLVSIEDGTLEREDRVVCSSCDTDFCNCVVCDTRLYGEGIYYFDDEPYCEECFDDRFSWDDYTFSYVPLDEMITAFIVPDDELEDVMDDRINEHDYFCTEHTEEFFKTYGLWDAMQELQIDEYYLIPMSMLVMDPDALIAVMARVYNAQGYSSKNYLRAGLRNTLSIYYDDELTSQILNYLDSFYFFAQEDFNYAF